MLLSYVYAVVDAAMFDTLLPDKSRLNYRFNNDQTKFIYKTYKEEPLLVGYSLYNNQQIQAIVSMDGWKNNLNV